ncbi:NF-kappa-B essential modulator-like [Biomphalaria glabrata]|uniref:NF-kappa-B essential modulator-like n=1 Tax=Biomphalaria glabrata TaxID=6526 RepID=A0A9W3A3G3_BIOGL|nr:NF-kappa-B essential modulator-like [Biomphalaria glabrata]XP_055881812.1 NF-kappa-B essential modulator-like [Biomphalaria glabrata]XP_055881813.1 NF-kappa-B essential modulator-like [Biomphalaria glabrata]XP_055881815.1 NF-kappa-B essential modulator-like [Biomphalaria glabrata]XP_055881816.1 NF-kappa-B essential modulator-like [Biomphalaria glabrata]
MQEKFSGVQESSSNSTTNFNPYFNDSSSVNNMAMASQESSKELKMSASSYSMTDISLEQAVFRLREIENENLALRDSLRQNNAVVKKQYEAVSEWRKREMEKFEQTKALITALRAEIQDLQEKLLAKDENEKSLTERLEAVEEEKAQVQCQKAISDQRMLNVCRLAEEQGIKGFKEDLDIDRDIVYVSELDKEATISQLEEEISSKEDSISQLKSIIQKLEADLAHSHEQTKLLLEDMKSQQKLKETMEEENRNLTKKIMDTEQKLHQQMQSVIASTRKEMQVEQGLSKSTNTTQPSSEVNGDSTFFSFPDNMEDLMHIAKSLEAKQQEEIKQKDLISKVEKSNEEKQHLLQEVERLKTEVQDLTAKVNNLQAQLIEERAKNRETTDKMSMEYEQKLMAMAKNKPDSKDFQAASNTDDSSALRSQVLSLLKEVYDAQNKCSAAIQANTLKDTRIVELENLNDALRQEGAKYRQSTTDLIQQLRSINHQSEKAQAENMSVKKQYSMLQESFSKLVTDYKELQETFESYRTQTERQARYPRQPTRETMEEINRLTAQVIAADEAIAYRDEQIAQLRAEIASNSFSEEIHLLKFQADLFKSDFAAEREARTKLAEEKSKLQEEMEQLRELNRTLREELDAYNQRQIRDIQRRFDDSERQRRTPPLNTNRFSGAGWNVFPESQVPVVPRQDEDEELKSFQQYDCPKCSTLFPDIDSLQLHVPDCIDN